MALPRRLHNASYEHALHIVPPLENDACRNQVIDFLGSFGLSRIEADDVIAAVGTGP